METLFPDTLTRLQYLVRFSIFAFAFMVISILLYFSFNAIGLAHSVFPWIVILLILLRIPCLDVPRFRSIGWSAWLALLILIPIINLIVQLMLFTMPPQDTDV